MLRDSQNNDITLFFCHFGILKIECQVFEMVSIGLKSKNGQKWLRNCPGKLAKNGSNIQKLPVLLILFLV